MLQLQYRVAVMKNILILSNCNLQWQIQILTPIIPVNRDLHKMVPIFPATYSVITQFQLSLRIDYRRLDWCSLPLICSAINKLLPVISVCLHVHVSVHIDIYSYVLVYMRLHVQGVIALLDQPK